MFELLGKWKIDSDEADDSSFVKELVELIEIYRPGEDITTDGTEMLLKSMSMQAAAIAPEIKKKPFSAVKTWPSSKAEFITWYDHEYLPGVQGKMNHLSLRKEDVYLSTKSRHFVQGDGKTFKDYTNASNLVLWPLECEVRLAIAPKVLADKPEVKNFVVLLEDMQNSDRPKYSDIHTWIRKGKGETAESVEKQTTPSQSFAIRKTPQESPVRSWLNTRALQKTPSPQPLQVNKEQPKSNAPRWSRIQPQVKEPEKVKEDEVEALLKRLADAEATNQKTEAAIMKAKSSPPKPNIEELKKRKAEEKAKRQAEEEQKKKEKEELMIKIKEAEEKAAKNKEELTKLVNQVEEDNNLLYEASTEEEEDIQIIEDKGENNKEEEIIDEEALDDILDGVQN